MTTNNDIICRWRDAISDPPPAVWGGLVRNDGRGRFAYALHEIFRPGDQWLDVTDRPGVAREAVQAAILEMRGQPPFGCDTWEVALDILQAHCGVEVAPSGVKESLTTQAEASDA